MLWSLADREKDSETFRLLFLVQVFMGKEFDAFPAGVIP
jgi:hypothetical protein